MNLFKAFCTRKERGGQTIHFRFYHSKLNSYMSHILVQSALVAGEQIAMCFSVKKNAYHRGSP